MHNRTYLRKSVNSLCYCSDIFLKKNDKHKNYVYKIQIFKIHSDMNFISAFVINMNFRKRNGFVIIILLV